MLMRHGYRVATGMLLLLLTACGALPVESRKRFFWPPPPNEPKIEYINFYVASDDMQRGVDNRLREAILGKKHVFPLFIQPFSVAIGTRNRIYVTDFSRMDLLVLDFDEKEHREVAVHTGGKLQKVVCDARGDIWVLDGLQSRLEQFDQNEQSLQVLMLKEVDRASSFAIDRDRDRIYVLDTPKHLIRIYTLAGTVVGQYGRLGAKPGEFNFPTDIDLDKDGNLFVLDTMNSRVQVLRPDGSFVRIFGERGTERGSFSRPKALALDKIGHVFVTDALYNKIVIFSTEGEYLLSVGGYQKVDQEKGVVPGGLDFPAGIAADATGQIWVADLFNAMVHQYQLMTPEYLLKHPVKPADANPPTAAELNPGSESAELSIIPGDTVTPQPVQ